MEKFTLNGEWRITSKTYDMIQPKKIAEQKRLLGYFYISQKFLSVDVWFGLCENSHNAKAKNGECKNIVKFFKLTDQMQKKCLC